MKCEICGQEVGKGMWLHMKSHGLSLPENTYEEEKNVKKQEQPTAPTMVAQNTPIQPPPYPTNPSGGLPEVVTNGIGQVMKVAEAFGVDKKMIGQALLKSVMTGKFDLFNLGNQEPKRTKFERALKALAWFFVPVFLFIAGIIALLAIKKFLGV